MCSKTTQKPSEEHNYGRNSSGFVSPEHYNTLGFDRELIDYIDLIEDTFIYDLVAPLYKTGGRNYHNPVTMFRAHYLYFVKSEITSYSLVDYKPGISSRLKD